MPIRPLADVPISPAIAALPKADLHIHQEDVARFERVVAQRLGRPPYDWRESARRLLSETPPGRNRLLGMYAPDQHLDLAGEPHDCPENVVAIMADAMEAGAADGALLLELRFGASGWMLNRPDFMTLFRDAERKVGVRYPHFCAEAIGCLLFVNDPDRWRTLERQLELCLGLSGKGLAGIDIVTDPYDTEADLALWDKVYDWAGRAAAAGLGITVHAGEFSTANLAAALRTPGLRRLGHAVYAARDARLLEQLAQSGVTVECSLSCNVVLGAVSSYESHPIRRFVEWGIPVTLSTDDPVRVWTTIGREYALAHALGFSLGDLFAFTRRAVEAAFTSRDRRQELFAVLNEWERSNPGIHLAG